MKRRPVVFFDTNIPINVANSVISGSEWKQAKAIVRSKYRHAISFVTIKELLCKLANGSPDYFSQNKRPLNVLYNVSPKSIFLPYPSCFALRTVLGISVSRDSELGDKVWTEYVVRAVLAAPNKQALKKGIGVSNSVHRRQWFDLDHFALHENGPQKEHAELLEGVRTGQINRPDPIKMSASIMEAHGLTPDTGDCVKLAGALDAAFKYEGVLADFAKNKGYDYDKHQSDWGDALQLMYLCDPNFLFVTYERELRKRLQHSPQAARICRWSDFLTKTHDRPIEI